MAFITIGPDITMTPRHRNVTFSITADYTGFCNVSCSTPGLKLPVTTFRLTAGVAANVEATVINAGAKTYTIIVERTGVPSVNDSCTVTVESIYTSFDMDTIKDTIKTAIEATRPSYKGDLWFSREGLTYNEYGLSIAQARNFYIEAAASDEGSSPNIHKLTYNIFIGYSEEGVYDSDMVELRNHLNNYDWPSGITLVWCPSIARSELGEEIPALIATLEIEIFS